jgi:hypothetical protein
LGDALFTNGVNMDTKKQKEVFDMLKAMVRMVEAFSYSTTLGKSQAERLREAKRLIIEVELSK